MSASLRRQLEDYLQLRRALGYRLERPETLLNQFLAGRGRCGNNSEEGT